jgi:hypothetical protein
MPIVLHSCITVLGVKPIPKSVQLASAPPALEAQLPVPVDSPSAPLPPPPVVPPHAALAAIARSPRVIITSFLGRKRTPPFRVRPAESNGRARRLLAADCACVGPDVNAA